MPSIPATRRASSASRTEQQPCLFFPPEVSHAPPAGPAVSTPFGDPRRRKAPITSYPSRSSSAAATELSTPPLIATTTFLRTFSIGFPAGRIIRRRPAGRARESYVEEPLKRDFDPRKPRRAPHSRRLSRTCLRDSFARAASRE